MMETREGNPVRSRRTAERMNPTWSRAISRSVMKIPGCIDMHLQDSDCARRALGVHFVRFQDFPPESRKSEFFTIARITMPSSGLHPLDASRARWNPFCRCNIPGQVLELPILFFIGKLVIRKLLSGFTRRNIRNSYTDSFTLSLARLYTFSYDFWINF